MSSSPALPDPADPARQRDEDAQYYRQILHELIEIGADLARSLHRQPAPAPSATPEPSPAAAAQPQAPQPDPTLAFERLARTLRRTIALARTLTEPAKATSAQGTGERRRFARKQIIRAVEDTIQRRTKDAEADALHAEFYERLDDPDLDDDLDHLPVADPIKAICRDLGIEHHPGTHPWTRRRPADVRALCARAAAPRTAQPALAQPRTPQPTIMHPRPGDPRPLAAPLPRTQTATGPPRP